MYSDLFDQLNASGRLTSNNNNNTATADNDDDNGALVHFKAGKVTLSVEHPPSFHCTADRTRGECRLVWKNHTTLEWQWYSRRDKKVVDTWNVHNYRQSTFQRVPHPSDGQARMYVWTRTPKEEPHAQYQMFWMQDASSDGENELVAKINQYLSDPQSAAPTTTNSSTAMDTQNAAAATNNNASQQVDALSNILQNLGMPQQQQADSNNNTLTLADLQGAMAGMQPTPALGQVVTPSAITTLLQDQDASQRLLELLPPSQRSIANLEENLRSPAVQQTLRSLTAALEQDLYSVMANFQLQVPPEDSSSMGNPIQTFLNALLESVEKEESKEEEKDGAEEKES